MTPKSMRVLVVTATFPPDSGVGSLRTLRLLKHLTEVGVEPEVLTVAPSTYRPGTVTDSARLALIPQGVRVNHAPAWRPIARCVEMVKRGHRREPTTAILSSQGQAPAQKAGPSRGTRSLRWAVKAALTLPDAEVSWILPAVSSGLRRSRSVRPDVIYSSGPPYSAHLAAAALSRLLNTPWVADFRDPWARAPWRDDRFAFEKRGWSLFERFIVRRADAVLFVTQANRDDFASEYGEAAALRFHVVPNGCDLTDFRGLVPGPEPERFVLLHAGTLYGARDPSPLFQALADCVAAGDIDRDRFRLRFIGRIGISGSDLNARLRDLGIERMVEFMPQMPRADVLQQMVDASALLIVQPVTKLSVPGKLYEYLAAGRPILALAEPDGDTANVLRRTPAGVVVSPTDREGMRKALQGLVHQGRRRIETDPALYDGGLRAAELAAILRNVMPASLRTSPVAEVAPASTKRS